MSALHFPPQLQSPVRRRAVRLCVKLRRRKSHVRSRLLGRDAEGSPVCHKQAVAELRVSERDLGVWSLFVDLIRSGIGIHEVRESLAEQEVLRLAVGMAQPGSG